MPFPQLQRLLLLNVCLSPFRAALLKFFLEDSSSTMATHMAQSCTIDRELPLTFCLTAVGTVDVSTTPIL